jgi:hypothetical protein
MIIPFGLKCTVFSAADLFSPSFEFPFYKITSFLWLQLLISVFAPTLTRRSLSLLFCSFPEGSDQKFRGQQGSYFRLRGTGGIQSFCLTPVCTSVIVFHFFQHCCCFPFELTPRSRVTVMYCVYRKAFVFICMNRLLFCRNFPPAFPLFAFRFLGRGFGPVLLLCLSSGVVWQLIWLLLRRSEVNLRTDFVNKRSSDSCSHCCSLSFEALTPKGLVASLCQLCALHLPLLPSRVPAAGVYLFRLIHADLTYSLLKNVVTGVTLFGFQATHQPFSEDPGCCQNPC